MEQKINPTSEDSAVPNSNLQVRVPKKILHFSDGTLEIYSEDEEEKAEEDKNEISNVDSSQLTWGPWFAYKAVQTGKSVLHACDYAGETLAYYLGITTPKYQYEIEEYERMQKEEKKRKEMVEGWTSDDEATTMTRQPEASPAQVTPV